MKIQTCELTGEALDWAVDVALGNTPIVVPFKNSLGCAIYKSVWAQREGIRSYYSTNWSQGGPIIEREEMWVRRRDPRLYFKGEEWEARVKNAAKGAGYKRAKGPTPLVAAMRAFVASKLGDEVEMPDELLENK
jgi:hypothetical protein